MSNKLAKMYILVNDDLKMGKGKIGSQIGHCVSSLIQKLEKNTSKNKYWLNNGEPMIILKTTEEKLLQLRKKYSKISVEIRDAGKTQVSPDSLTTIGFIPLYEEEIPLDLTTMKLL
jgi:PTH2 family peptidyl-tRNA hydrolase